VPKTHTITDECTYEGIVMKSDLPHRHILPKVEDWEIEKNPTECGKSSGSKTK
jgi:hypothetical protein